MEKQAIAVLFETHYMQMYRLARTLLYDEDESKDVVSEVFAQLLDARADLRAETAGAYLLASVRNRCLNRIEHRKTVEKFAQLYAEEHALAQSPAEDEQQLRDLLRYVDERLPELTRNVFRLRFLNDLKYEEIADRLGISKVTVYHHLSQSLALIHRFFQTKKTT